MWLVEGAFDQIGSANLEQTKLKLLKPGKSYPLGRKQKHPLQLVLSHPKISGEHITFIVGGHPVDSVSDPAFRPSLKAQNHRNKPLQISRTVGGGVTRHLLQASSEDELLPGDCIALVTGIYTTVHWRPICCLLPPKSPSVPFDKCASLGVKVVSTPRPEVTHHLTATLSSSTSLATSLVSLAHVVRPDWLSELLHLGETVVSDGGPSVLEAECRLPLLTQYIPKYDDSLPAPLKSPSIWEPNERRAGMLKGWRFLFVGEKGREVDAETRALVERAGGEYEVFDVSGGLTRWKQSLSRNKKKVSGGGKNISVIGDTETLKMAVGETWAGMLEELNRAELRFVSHSQLIEAVLFVDAARINSSVVVQTEQDFSLPEVVPNTHEDAPTPSVGTSHSTEVPISAARAVQKERASSPDAASPIGHATTSGVVPAQPEQSQPQEPEPDNRQSSRASEEPEGTAVRRKPLVRRARTNATQHQFFGVDDPSFASFTSSQLPAIEVQSVEPTSAAAVESQVVEKPLSSQSVQTGRSSRLKKRARTNRDYNPILASLEEEIAAAAAPPAQQPPLKRFKALFDETDPDRVASQMTNGVSGGILDSQLFSQGSAGNANDDQGENRPVQPPLVVIHEEEEQSQSLPAQRAARRDKGHMETGDVAPSGQPQAKPSSSKAMSQGHAGPFDSTQLRKRAISKGGAAPGKPDTDAAFLQALSSTKKGKRKEDDFDREFNNLRISKPERGQDAEAEDWHVLADFGDDNNIRGNFMVIVEMDVPEKPKEASRESSVATNRGPDFKKFKKQQKTTGRQQPSVELVVDDENDYGMGPAYWKGAQSQHQSQGVTQGDAASIPQQGFLQPSQTLNRGFLRPKAGPSSQLVKPRSQGQTQTQGKTTKSETQRTQRQTRSRPLVISDEDEDDSGGVQLHAPRKGRAATNGGARNAKSQPLFLSDEEESEDRSAGKADRGEGDRGDAELALALEDDVEMSDDEPAPPTLRSTAQSSADAGTRKSASPTKRAATAKKRNAALLDDDSDTGMAFKGFSGRKRAKAK